MGLARPRGGEGCPGTDPPENTAGRQHSTRRSETQEPFEQRTRSDVSLSEVALAAAGRVPGGSRCEGGTWTGRGRLGVKLQLWRERGNACRGPTVPVTPAHSRMGGRATVTASHVLLPPHPLRPKPPSKTEAAREASQPTMSSDAKDMCGWLAGGPWTASAAHGEPASLLWRWTSPAQDPAVSLRSLEPRGSQSWTGSTGSPSDCRLTNEQDCALAGAGKATVTVTACILVTQSPAGRGVTP